MRVALVACAAMVIAPCRAADESLPDTQQLVIATRDVVSAVAHAGKDTRRKNEDSKARLERIVMAAAVAAQKSPEDVQRKAFLLGLAVGCDRAGALRELPVLGKFAIEVESDEEHARRVKGLSPVHMMGREDLALHFFVSAYLTVRLGSAAADAAGLAKELRDAEGRSGFSFADLAADRAGVQFALDVLEKRIELDALARQFTLSDHMPSIEGLDEGLSLAEFKAQYGSTSDERFQAVITEIDERLKQLKSKE